HYFFPEQFEKLKQLSKKRGMIVTSGPTGSGKTTTMYQLIKQISSEKFVMTIEDPIEILEPDFLQTQINNQAGIDYLSL
ncbi:ATPase, T2SS/T4P/T4SS family, partial [Corynebacterium coyleae]